MRDNQSNNMIAAEENRVQIPVVALPDSAAKIDVNILSLKTPQVLSVPGQILPEFEPIAEGTKPPFSLSLPNVIYSHSIAAFSLLILAIALVSLPLINRYTTFDSIKPMSKNALDKTKLPGLNIAINKADFNNWLNQFTTQTASLNLGSKTVTISPATIKSWINYAAPNNSQIYNVHLNTKVVNSSIINLAKSYEKQPFNQVEATKSDGSTETAVYGRNGFKLEDIKNVSAEASNVAKNLFSNKGFSISAPLQSLPFQTVTPASFNKLILVDVNSKVMNVYQEGKIVNTFAVSAGAVATPTPIGEYHIYAKYAVQDMNGYNPNGTKYFQPKVKWVNYFSGADAVHGVYWHPLSWFGVHNSSHGCVGLPDSEAQWIYNWAPIGTTVITTAN